MCGWGGRGGGLERTRNSATGFDQLINVSADRQKEIKMDTRPYRPDT